MRALTSLRGPASSEVALGAGPWHRQPSVVTAQFSLMGRPRPSSRMTAERFDNKPNSSDLKAVRGRIWFRLMVRSDVRMPRMIRWPRKKSDQKNNSRERRSRSRGLNARDGFQLTPARREADDSRQLGDGIDRRRRGSSRGRYDEGSALPSSPSPTTHRQLSM